MQIVESLYHKMFLYLDLAHAMNPERLYAHASFPIGNRAAWWERLKRLAIPKIQSLFPWNSPFYNFNRWFSCTCLESNQAPLFPLRQGWTTDPLFWGLYCPVCQHPEQNTYDCNSLSWAAFKSDRDCEFLRRRGLRNLLNTATGFKLIYRRPGEHGSKETWSLLSDPLKDGYPIWLRASTDRFALNHNQHPFKPLSFNCDFRMACIILSQPEIPQ
jgi:hypothetical protein